MLTECPQCNAKVDGQPVAELVAPIHDAETQDFYEMNYSSEYEQECTVTPQWLYVLIRCPACADALLVRRFDFEAADRSQRVWPPLRAKLFGLPLLIAEAVDEAVRCLDAKAPLACVLMCRRALEAMCRHHYPDIRPLAFGLKKLEDDGIIDSRLAHWSRELKDSGNLAAHDPQAGITQEDAADLLDFTEAILSYVFVLHARFEEFKRRRGNEAPIT